MGKLKAILTSAAILIGVACMIVGTECLIMLYALPWFPAVIIVIAAIMLVVCLSARIGEFLRQER